MNYSPQEIAANYRSTAAHKAAMPSQILLFRAVLAGALIALAAYGANSIAALFENQAAAKLISALLFPAGLAMILLCGGELFTSACLMLLAIGKRGISFRTVLRCWAVIFLGNFAGAAIIALLTVGARHADASFIQATLHTAQLKHSLAWTSGFYRGVLCNVLVCTAVWMSYGTNSVSGKILALYFPIVLFVLTGTEHSVTNMYYFAAAFMAGPMDGISFSSFLLHHLLPVTLGNLLGGGILFGGLIWLSFLAGSKSKNLTDNQ